MGAQPYGIWRRRLKMVARCKRIVSHSTVLCTGNPLRRAYLRSANSGCGGDIIIVSSSLLLAVVADTIIGLSVLCTSPFVGRSFTLLASTCGNACALDDDNPLLRGALLARWLATLLGFNGSAAAADSTMAVQTLGYRCAYQAGCKASSKKRYVSVVAVVLVLANISNMIL